MNDSKEQWRTLRLEKLCIFRNGRAHEGLECNDGKYIIVNSKFISSNGKVKRMTNNALEPVSKGEILMVMSDVPNGKAIAKAFLVEENERYTLNQRICAFSCSKEVVDKFLYYKINRNKYFLSFDDGVNQTNLRKDDILKCKISLPIFEEQKAIVSVMEEWDKYIELLDQKIQTKKNIKKYLQQVLLTGEIRLGCFKQAWEEYELGKVCKVLKGRGLSKELLEENGEMECILYGELYTKYNEIIDTVVSYTNVKEGIKSVSGDVLIPASTTTNALDVATASCIKKSGVLLGGDINIFRPSEQVDGEFLAQYLSHTKKIEMAKLAQGITIVHLYGKDIKKLKIQIPEIEEQKAISSILSKSDEEIAMLEKQKGIIEEQRKYLLNNLVTGKIRLPKFINSK